MKPLPEPDPFGNYWPGAAAQPPCVLRYFGPPKTRVETGGGAMVCYAWTGRYFAPTAAGPVWGGGPAGFALFDTPGEAAEAIRAAGPDTPKRVKPPARGSGKPRRPL